MLCHQILVQLCHYSPLQIAAHTNILMSPLKTTVSKTVKKKKNGVGTEVERAYDVIRSALRALDAVQSIPETKTNKDVLDLVAFVDSQETLKRLMTVEKQHTSNIWSNH